MWTGGGGRGNGRRRGELGWCYETVSNEKRRDEEVCKYSQKGIVSLQSDCHGGGGEELPQTT